MKISHNKHLFYTNFKSKISFTLTLFYHKIFILFQIVKNWIPKKICLELLKFIKEIINI